MLPHSVSTPFSHTPCILEWTIAGFRRQICDWSPRLPNRWKRHAQPPALAVVLAYKGLRNPLPRCGAQGNCRSGPSRWDCTSTIVWRQALTWCNWNLRVLTWRASFRRFREQNQSEPDRCDHLKSSQQHTPAYPSYLELAISFPYHPRRYTLMTSGEAGTVSKKRTLSIFSGYLLLVAALSTFLCLLFFVSFYLSDCHPSVYLFLWLSCIIICVTFQFSAWKYTINIY